MQVTCKEPNGEVIHTVTPMVFTRDSLGLLWEQCSKFPVLFQKPLGSLKDFLDYFLTENLSGDPEPTGLMWLVDGGKTGFFYMDEMRQWEATVHYSFFDKRTKGREPLVRAMTDMVFETFGYNRLNVYIPAYAGMVPRLFVERCGFRIEGKKRKAYWWKDKLFDVYCYGLLREDLNERIS